MLHLQAKHVSIKLTAKGKHITFFTTEDIDELDLLMINKAPGFLLFSPDLIAKSVEDAMKDKKIGIDYNGKSPSTKLRGKLMELWQKKYRNSGISFEDYYTGKIDEMVKYFDSKL